MWDFVANATVDSIDVVPEQFKGLYAEKDGKFTISDTAKGIVEAYNGQTNALTKARKDLTTANGEAASRRVTAKAVLEYVKGLGVETVNEENPLETLQSHVNGLIESSKKGGDLKVNLDKIKGESERRIAEVQAAEAAKTEKMKASLHKYLVENAAISALAKAKGNSELLLDKVLKSARVVEDGDNYVVRIVDDAGEVRSNGAGGYMDFDGYVAELKTKPAYAIAFASEAKGGSDHKPGSSQQRVNVNTQVEKNATDKIAAGLNKKMGIR